MYLPIGLARALTLADVPPPELAWPAENLANVGPYVAAVGPAGVTLLDPADPAWRVSLAVAASDALGREVDGETELWLCTPDGVWRAASPFDAPSQVVGSPGTELEFAL